MQGVEHSSAAGSDEEGPHEADEVIETVEEEVEVEVLQGPRLREAFLFLDTVDPMRIFRPRGPS